MRFLSLTHMLDVTWVLQGLIEITHYVALSSQLFDVPKMNSRRFTSAKTPNSKFGKPFKEDTSPSSQKMSESAWTVEVMWTIKLKRKLWNLWRATLFPPFAKYTASKSRLHYWQAHQIWERARYTLTNAWIKVQSGPKAATTTEHAITSALGCSNP